MSSLLVAGLVRGGEGGDCRNGGVVVVGSMGAGNIIDFNLGQ